MKVLSVIAAFGLGFVLVFGSLHMLGKASDGMTNATLTALDLPAR
ncbi:MAG: hypothetical protein AB7N54_09365 [Alphaproteobacteria bacterium]